jgi:polyhydroxybutyrate depolymerase
MNWKKKRNRWARHVLFMCLMYSALSSAATAEVMKWTVGGVQREAMVFGPSRKTDSGKAPLVFAFHGHGDTMQNFAEGVRISWPEAIVVYPQGLPTNAADDPEGFGWVYKPGTDEQRDVMFFDAMLETIRAKFPVDNQRIYATGFSNGGMFTYVLWGARANIFAAFAAVAGRIVPEVHLSMAKPLLVVAGEQDETVPYKEQLKAIQTARAVNGTNDAGVPCGRGCTTYASSKSTPVTTYIHGGGHV